MKGGVLLHGLVMLPRYLLRLALLSLLLTGCKQGVGEVCQIDDDCEDGLECNAGTMRCQRPGANIEDAAPPADAAVPDASVADAGVDAAP